ncbi:MAG: DoxX family protein, partial [Anaerolineales bacterium]|nr:DoxX family protein [Anaerolineales bacterium]
VLWILQILLGVYFTLIGVMHFIVPPGLPPQMAWMYELSTTLHYVSGIAEILGGLGLILPAVTRIRTNLVPLAALWLTLVMIGAVIYHAGRGESQNIGFNLVLAALLAFVAYGRWKLKPLADRSSAEQTA